jgi:hypothetical protein
MILSEQRLRSTTFSLAVAVAGVAAVAQVGSLLGAALAILARRRTADWSFRGGGGWIALRELAVVFIPAAHTVCLYSTYRSVYIVVVYRIRVDGIRCNSSETMVGGRRRRRL